MGEGISMSHLVAALVMVIIVVAIIAFTPSKLYALSNFIKDKFNIQTTQEKITNQEAISRFDVLAKGYSDCISSQDTNCLCFKKGFEGKEEFPLFPSQHYIIIKQSETNADKTDMILYDKNNEEVKRAKINTILTCIYERNRGKISTIENNFVDHSDEEFKITFQTPGRIDVNFKDRGQDSIPKDNFPFAYKKDNSETCFVLYETSGLAIETKINFWLKDDLEKLKQEINNLPLCLPNRQQAEQAITEIKNQYDKCKVGTCNTITLNLPEDYTILHDTKNTLYLIYLNNNKEPVKTIFLIGTYCYSSSKTYFNSNELTFKKDNNNNVCINQKA